MDALRTIEKARLAGLVIDVDGDTLHLRGPKSAEPIVREIQENKDAVLSTLKSEVNQCNDETFALVTWFREEGQHLIPSESFKLTRWITVTKPEKFKESLLSEISRGSQGLRWRRGLLLQDLRFLKKALSHE